MTYFTILTQKGLEKITTATSNKTTVNLSEIAFGDGNGTIPTPNSSNTALVNEVFRTQLSDLKVDSANVDTLVTESFIPSNEGGFWIREIGLYDTQGDLIAIGNYPETFKPVMAEGVAKDLYVKVLIKVSNTDAITLQIDPSNVMASQEFVNDKLKNRPTNEEMNTVINNIQTFPIGFPMLSYVAYDFTIVALGGQFKRAYFPELWKYIDSSIVKTEAEWQALNNANGMCGFFSSGDGNTTFRAPNLNEAFFRASNRGVGSFELDEFKSHNHGSVGSAICSSGSTYTIPYVTGDSGVYTKNTGGNETRPKNIALLPLIVAK